MNYTLFIADLHLDQFSPNKITGLLQLLRTHAKAADAFYILGDFFQAWIGDDDDSAFVTQIKATLKEFTDNGPPTYILYGNHDFLMGTRFCEETGCRLIRDLTIIDLYGTKTLISHGDILCSEDLLHVLFHKLARSCVLRWLFLKLPLKLRRKMADIVVNLSQKHKQKPSFNEECISQQTIDKLVAKHKVTQMIHGHTHKANLFELTLGDQNSRRITLGSWDDSTYRILLYNSDNSFTQTTVF